MRCKGTSLLISHNSVNKTNATVLNAYFQNPKDFLSSQDSLLRFWKDFSQIELISPIGEAESEKIVIYAIESPSTYCSWIQ